MFKPAFTILHLDVRKTHHSVCDTKREISVRVYDEYGKLDIVVFVVYYGMDVMVH